jgi:hypothetical protein
MVSEILEVIQGGGEIESHTSSRKCVSGGYVTDWRKKKRISWRMRYGHSIWERTCCPRY